MLFYKDNLESKNKFLLDFFFRSGHFTRKFFREKRKTTIQISVTVQRVWLMTIKENNLLIFVRVWYLPISILPNKFIQTIFLVIGQLFFSQELIFANRNENSRIRENFFPRKMYLLSITSLSSNLILRPCSVYNIWTESIYSRRLTFVISIFYLAYMRGICQIKSLATILCSHNIRNIFKKI